MNEADETREIVGDRGPIRDELRHTGAIFVGTANRLRGCVDRDCRGLDANGFDAAYKFISVGYAGSEVRGNGDQIKWNFAYPFCCQSRSRVRPVAAVEFFIRGG